MKKVSDIKKEWLNDNVNKLSKTGKSKADVARDLGIKPQFLNSLINGPRGITDQFIDKFIITFKLNQYALSLQNIELLNEPPPIYDKMRFDAQKIIIQAQQDTIKIQKRYINSLEKELLKLKEDKEPVEDGQKRKVV